ncbi:myosin-binding protein 5 [Populus alba x Populus x berolinensis]|uniref:Myosin-binding protein 5 n=1 Tax=Populus alba x Populus x berolinensis TaxID=444605 RepID=A0AAD6LNE9_9ROSI|nr:myosin-binding protein 5 [Populus alba x Populus x berolinensis]
MAKRSFKCFVEQDLGKLPLFLIYAVLEWVLIAVVFIDGLLAFFANEFTKFFELKIPCLLCTRIDLAVVRRDADLYYNQSICENHKKEVSSLAYCRVHKKLSDIRKMREGCLLSFAAKKESDCDTYKSPVRVLHKNIELFVEDDRDIHLRLPTVRKDNTVPAEKSNLHQGSCCGNPLKVKAYTKGKIAGTLSQAPPPSPSVPLVSLRNEDPRKLDLSHVRYTELDVDVKAAMVPLLTEAENTNEDWTSTFSRGNKFLGTLLTDSATASPRAFTRFPRKSFLDETEDASEFTEVTCLSNELVDDDSILHHLKKQVRLDRKLLMALYMELDEERSASAVAANNAMAMITWLQAERAAVQMEAIQYQRMMEEQAEYDQDALQATRDILSKREEQIKCLEFELMAYRENYGALSGQGFMGSGDEIDEDCHELKPYSLSS